MVFLSVGILHPGEMGTFLAASARNSGRDVWWASEGRSAATHARAEQAELRDAGSLTKLCRRCDLLVSVCPPDFAQELACAVVAAGFQGAYLDANAIAPQRSHDIDLMMREAGIRYIDGGIIGGSDWEGGSTVLYLCGEHAPGIVNVFEAGPLRVTVMEAEIGAASALKMCYAALTKGSTALLCAVLAAAQQYGVIERLLAQWDADDPGSADRAVQRARRVTAKAWRFEGEMMEIARTFREAGVPDGFHQAAGEVYRRLAQYRDAPDRPEILDVLGAIVRLGDKDADNPRDSSNESPL